jgi:hypothetical protein
MPYNYQIPQANTQLSISQGDILNNFTALGAIAGNSTPASASLDATGFKWVYIPPQGNIPPAGSAFPQFNVGIYSALNVPSGQYELYINKTDPVSMATIQVPATALNYAATGFNGWTYLPSGAIMTWGFSTIVAGGTFTVMYNNTAAGGLNGFPGFRVYGTPVVTRYRTVAPPADAFVYISAYTQTSFTVYSSTGGNNVSFSWMAIGV